MNRHVNNRMSRSSRVLQKRASNSESSGRAPQFSEFLNCASFFDLFYGDEFFDFQYHSSCLRRYSMKDGLHAFTKPKTVKNCFCFFWQSNCYETMH